VQPGIKYLAKLLWRNVDQTAIDEGLVDGTGRVAVQLSLFARMFQNGKVSRYAGYFVFGVVLLKDRRFVFRPSCDKHNLFGDLFFDPLAISKDRRFVFRPSCDKPRTPMESAAPGSHNSMTRLPELPLRSNYCAPRLDDPSAGQATDPPAASPAAADLAGRPCQSR
jgi:hypothetical protein